VRNWPRFDTSQAVEQQSIHQEYPCPQVCLKADHELARATASATTATRKALDELTTSIFRLVVARRRAFKNEGLPMGA